VTNKYKVVGVNDDRSFCECCGKQGLKRVVWIENTETHDVKHFGTTCATSPDKGFGVEKDIKEAVRKFENQQSAIYRYAYALYRKAGGAIKSTSRTSWSITNKTLYDECLNAARAQYKTEK